MTCKPYLILQSFNYKNTIALVVFLDEIYGGLPLIKGEINNSMVKYKHYIPRLYDIINKLHESCMFSNIDLKIGYNIVKMNEGDEEKNNIMTKT